MATKKKAVAKARTSVTAKKAVKGGIARGIVTTYSRKGDPKLAPVNYDEVNRQIRAVARMRAEDSGEMLLKTLVKAGQRAQRTLQAAAKKKAAKKK